MNGCLFVTAAKNRGMVKMRDFDIHALKRQLMSTDCHRYPMADQVELGVLIYDADELLRSPAAARAELYDALLVGPGVLVVRNLIQDHDVIDRASEIFERIIEREKAGGGAQGDHFAKPGANDRIWNSFEKHCLADPHNFAAYYSNEALFLVCQSWLGPAFQMTAQVNRVNPGGHAQRAHRDYHLGFMTQEQIRAYPPSVHHLSPMLTLQGAIAHVDMPTDAGPTMYLPHSQKWDEGYVYASKLEVQTLFAENMVQLPLGKGDGAFFNPGLLHGAGENRSDNIYRMGNLLQVNSALGRPMEQVDREAMLASLDPILSDNAWTAAGRRLLIDMVADGYPFPTDLDVSPPVGGLAPPSQAQKIKSHYGL